MDDAEKRTMFISMKKIEYLKMAKKYDNMVSEVSNLAEKLTIEGKEISKEHRLAIGFAFQNLLSPHRISYKTLLAEKEMILKTAKKNAEGTETTEMTADSINILDNIVKNIREEILEICNKGLSVIGKILEQEINQKNLEAFVYFLKLMGDYNRYKCEVCYEEEVFEEFKRLGLLAYQKAQDISQKLRPSNSSKLGLTLNFSVMQYEICNEKSLACSIAEKAFEDALQEIDVLIKDSYSDSVMLLQLLRDNVTLWRNDSDRSYYDDTMIKQQKVSKDIDFE